MAIFRVKQAQCDRLHDRLLACVDVEFLTHVGQWKLTVASEQRVIIEISHDDLPAMTQLSTSSSRRVRRGTCRLRSGGRTALTTRTHSRAQREVGMRCAISRVNFSPGAVGRKTEQPTSPFGPWIGSVTPVRMPCAARLLIQGVAPHCFEGIRLPDDRQRAGQAMADGRVDVGEALAS
jgi:hypothetical protein